RQMPVAGDDDELTLVNASLYSIDVMGCFEMVEVYIRPKAYSPNANCTTFSRAEEKMETSYLMSTGKALKTFPMLKQDGLVGALVCYDGK
ncbi:hypothetical protein C0993_010460, partial [Termitomyces sp. T159_Od127]